MFHRMVGSKLEADLEEFEDAREVVAALSEEYAAAESSDYVRGPLLHLPVCCLPAVLKGRGSAGWGRVAERSDYVRGDLAPPAPVLPAGFGLGGAEGRVG